jgi:1-phosphatidylinositol-3-phosphate 5-kinase
MFSFQCTVLLRGGTSAELIKVKKITSFLVFVAYNWRLERSFHIDSFSMPPEQTEKSKCTNSSEDLLENKSQEALESQNNNCFQSTLEHVILSASPFITYPLPYLETEAGKVCELRKFFPDILYWSSRAIKSSIDLENNNIEDSYDAVLLNSKACVDKPRIHWEQQHSFTTSKLTSSISADEVQVLIADFRRKGSRLELISQGNFMTSEDCNRSDASSWNTVEHDKLKPGNGEEQIDALDPLKHQRLSVLFCSYSPVSANAPYFCVNPW